MDTKILTELIDKMSAEADKLPKKEAKKNILDLNKKLKLEMEK